MHAFSLGETRAAVFPQTPSRWGGRPEDALRAEQGIALHLVALRVRSRTRPPGPDRSAAGTGDWAGIIPSGVGTSSPQRPSASPSWVAGDDTRPKSTPAAPIQKNIDPWTTAETPVCHTLRDDAGMHLLDLEHAWAEHAVHLQLAIAHHTGILLPWELIFYIPHAIIGIPVWLALWHRRG